MDQSGSLTTKPIRPTPLYISHIPHNPMPFSHPKTISPSMTHPRSFPNPLTPMSIFHSTQPFSPSLNPSSSSSSYTTIPNSQPSKKHRPKPKKLSSSTNGKHRNVQVNLEVKVEKAKGFHAFFVPLAKSLPPAPPSSPVLHPRQQSNGFEHELTEQDYFGQSWDKSKVVVRREEEWVEDVSGEESMEIDSE